MALGKQVKKARLARGIRRGDLAKAIGCSQQRLQALEERDSKKSGLLKPIADHLRIDVEWFLKDDGSPVPEPNAATGKSVATSQPMAEPGDEAMNLIEESKRIAHLWLCLNSVERAMYKRAMELLVKEHGEALDSYTDILLKPTSGEKR